MTLEELKIFYAAHVLYIEDLDVLESENKAFMKGQLILAVDVLDRVGIKRGYWDFKNEQPYDAAKKFNESPWLIAPEAAGVGGLNAFKVRTSNTVGYPKYEVVGDVCTITDPRLIGVADPLISCTVVGADLRDEYITKDLVAGKITIANYPVMSDQDHFSIVVPSFIKSEDSVGALAERVAKLERANALTATGMEIRIFRGTKEQILASPGFTILTETEGRALFGYNEDDPRFDTIWDGTGNKGHYEELLIAEHIPDHYHHTAVSQYAAIPGHPSFANRVVSAIRAMIVHYYKNDVAPGYGGTQTYELCGAEKNINDPTDPDIPDVGPTSPWGTKEDDRKTVNVLNPYITVWFVGYTPESI